MKIFSDKLFFIATVASIVYYAEGALKSSRSVGELAPETNKHNKKRAVCMDCDYKEYSTVLFQDATPSEKSIFEITFEDFITSKHFEDSIFHLLIPDNLSEDVILDIRSHSFVEALEHVVEIRENELYFNKQRIGVRNLEDVNPRPESVIYLGNKGNNTWVYVVDSGIDDHSQFGNRIDRSLSKTFEVSREQEDFPSYDCRGHGTNVAGVIAGTNTGVASLATLVSYSIMHCVTGVALTTTIVSSLDSILADATKYPDRKIVVNLSNGFTGVTSDNHSIKEAERRLHEKNVLIVRAAGNHGQDACDYGQMGLIHSLSVGFTGDDDYVHPRSNIGDCVDIYAPGADITVPNYSKKKNTGKGLGHITGSSFAAPLVAGTAAFIWSNNPSWTASMVMSHIEDNATLEKIKGLPIGSHNKMLYLESTTRSFSNSAYILGNPKYSNYKFPPEAAISYDWVKTNDLGCKRILEPDKNYIYDATSLEEAKRICRENVFCSGVEDVGCNENEFLLCAIEINATVSSNGSCVHFPFERLEVNSPVVINQITNEECMARAITESMNIVQYEVHTKQCTLFVTEKNEITLEPSEGTYLVYSEKGNLFLNEIHGYFRSPRDTDYSRTCFHCSSLAEFLNVANTFDCAERASFVGASSFQFDQVAKICLLCQGTVDYDSASGYNEDYVAYATPSTNQGKDYSPYYDDILDDERYVLNLNMSLSNCVLRQSVSVRHNWSYCSRTAAPADVSVTEFVFALTGNGTCNFYTCPPHEIGFNYYQISSNQSTIEPRNMVLVKSDVIPEETNGFSLYTSLATNGKKIICDSMKTVTGINLEECSTYTFLNSFNAFNFRMGEKICEPKFCRKSDLTNEIRDSIESGWLMYTNPQLIDNGYSLLVHLLPFTSDITDFISHFGNAGIHHQTGSVPNQYSQLIIFDSNVGSDIIFLTSHDSVVGLEFYGNEDLKTTFFDSLTDNFLTPLEKVNYAREKGSVEFSPKTSSFFNEEVHFLDLSRGYTKSDGQERSGLYNSNENHHGAMSSYGFSAVSGGKGKGKPFLGELGIPVILNGEYTSKWLNGEFESKWLNGEFESKWLNGEFEAKFLNGAFDTKFLNGEFEEKFLNGEYESKWMNGEFDSKWLNGEFESKWLNGEFEDKFLNGEYEEKYLNGEYENNFLNGGYESKWLNGEFETKMLNGEFETKFMNGEFEDKWLNGEYDSKWLNGEFGEKYLNGEFEIKWLNGEYETKWLNGEFETVYLNGKFQAKFLNGEFEDLNGELEVKILNGEFETKWLNGEFETVFLNGVFETVFMNAEFEDKWLNGEYDAKWLNGEFGDTFINGEFEIKWLNGEYETKWLNGEFETVFLNREFQAKYLNGEFEDLSGELEVKYLNGEFETKWMNGEFETKYLNGEFEDKWLNGEYGVSWLNGGYEDKWLNGEFEVKWLTGAFGSKWLNGEHESKWLNAEFATKWLNGEFQGKWLNGEFGLAVLHGDFNLPFLHGDFGLSILNGDFGFPFFQSENAFPRLSGFHGKPSIAGSYLFKDEKIRNDDYLFENLLEDKNRVGGYNPQYWEFAANETCVSADCFAINQLHFPGALMTNSRVFKLLVDETKSSHLNCPSVAQYTGIDTIEECAALLTEEWSHHTDIAEYNYQLEPAIVSPDVQTGLLSYEFSSQHGGDADITHDRGWLDSPQAWSSGSNTIGNYYQINLGFITPIAGVVLQGRADYDQWVTTFTVEYSYNSNIWHSVDGGTLFNGNNDRNTKKNYLFQTSIHAQSVRIYPQSWYMHMSMRSGILVKKKEMDFWTQNTFVYCHGETLGSYDNLSLAYAACVDMGILCGGVLDYGCDNTGSFYICPRMKDSFSTSRSSCVYTSPDPISTKYTKHETGGCGRSELGQLNGVTYNECKKYCDVQENCLSFEYEKIFGVGNCLLSNSCTFEESDYDLQYPNTLYVKRRSLDCPHVETFTNPKMTAEENVASCQKRAQYMGFSGFNLDEEGCHMKLCEGELKFSFSGKTQEVYLNHNPNVLLNSGFDLPFKNTTVTWDLSIPSSWTAQNRVGFIYSATDFVNVESIKGVLSKHVFLNDGALSQIITRDLTDKTCNLYADIASRNDGNMRNSYFQFSMSDSTGSKIYSGESIYLDDFSSPGKWTGFSDQFQIPKSGSAPYNFTISNHGGQIHVDNVKMYCTKPTHGFSYSPALKQCVSKKCENGIYEIIPSAAGWLSYIAPGYYPSALKGFNLLPRNKQGRLSCEDNDGDGAIFTNIISAEACIESALTRDEPIINYKVSVGECEVLSCGQSNAKMNNTGESDVYTYTKDNVNIVDLDNELSVPATVGKPYNGAHQVDDYIVLGDNRQYDARTLEFDARKGKLHGGFQVTNDFVESVSGSWLTSYVEYDIYSHAENNVIVSPQEKTAAKYNFAEYHSVTLQYGWLDSSTAWCSSGAGSGSNKYYEIDFGLSKDVTGVITQGRANALQWVTSYKITYSYDGDNWLDVDNGKVFTGNVDQSTKVSNSFDTAINTRYIRIYPQTHSGYSCLRFGVTVNDGYVKHVGFYLGGWSSYGTGSFASLELAKAKCDTVADCGGVNFQGSYTLRVGSTPVAYTPESIAYVKGTIISPKVGEGTIVSLNLPTVALYNFTEYHSATLQYGWLDSSTAWCSSGAGSGTNKYYETDLGISKDVLGVITQGRHGITQWVTTYKVTYSSDGQNWLDVDNGRIFTGNVDESAKVSNYFDTTVNTRFIRIYPQTHSGYSCMRSGVIVDGGSTVTLSFEVEGLSGTQDSFHFYIDRPGNPCTNSQLLRTLSTGTGPRVVSLSFSTLQGENTLYIIHREFDTRLRKLSITSGDASFIADRGYTTYDVWSEDSSSVSISFEVETDDTNLLGASIYVCLANDLDSCHASQIVIGPLPTTFGIETRVFTPKKGMNKLWIFAGSYKPKVRSVTIASGNAHFYEKKAFPVKWNDYVTINTDFSNGENRGRKLLTVSTGAAGGILQVARKETNSQFSSFQLRRPGEIKAEDDDECIRWNDDVIVASKYNQVDQDCGPFGCRVGKETGSSVEFSAGGSTPYAFKILPPVGSLKTSSSCIHVNDRFRLSFSAGTKFMSIGNTGSEVTFSTTGTTLATFRHIHGSRTLKWRDHIVINAGFNETNSLYGNSILFTASTEKDTYLRVGDKVGTPQLTSFRLLQPEGASGSAKDCIRWGDAFVLKLNNAASEEGCDSDYGCRVLREDNGLVFGDSATKTLFTASPPTGVERVGCIHSGEQLQLSRDASFETVSPSTPTGDVSFSYSGIHSSCHPGLSGYLDGAYGWCAASNIAGTAYYQINLGGARMLAGVVMQGRGDHNQWVKTFTAKYSVDGISWFPIDSGAVFNGNSDLDTKINVYFQLAVSAKFVQIYPQTYSGHMSMRSGALVKNGTRPHPKFDITYSRPTWIKHTDRYCIESGFFFSTLREAQEACFHRGESCTGISNRDCDDRSFYLCSPGVKSYSTSGYDCYYEPVFQEGQIEYELGATISPNVNGGTPGFTLSSPHANHDMPWIDSIRAYVPPVLGDYVTFDLGAMSICMGIVVQGRAHDDGGLGYGQYTKAYRVEYSTDGTLFFDIDAGVSFPGNTETGSQKVSSYFTTPVDARYIRVIPVERNNEGAIRAGVITAYSAATCGDTNLALGKYVTSSSLSSSYPPSRLVDGIINNFMHTANEANPWVEIDLGAEYHIGDIIIRNRADCCQDRIVGFKVETFDFNHAKISSFQYAEWNSVLPIYKRYVGASKYRARFVRLTLVDKTEYLNLSEIEVYEDMKNCGFARENVFAFQTFT